MKYSKLRIAQLQIEKSITLFVHEQDYICSLVLAAAAEETLGNILHKTGELNVLAEFFSWAKDNDNAIKTFSHWAKTANKIRDELKHGHQNPDPNFELEVTEQDATQMIMRALSNYMAFEQKPSGMMFEFYDWLKQHENEIMNEW